MEKRQNNWYSHRQFNMYVHHNTNESGFFIEFVPSFPQQINNNKVIPIQKYFAQKK